MPTLTLPGASLQNRMGLSVLRALGLEEALVAKDAAGYVARAVALTQSGAELAAWRHGLRARLLATPALHPVHFAEAFLALLHGVRERA